MSARKIGKLILLLAIGGAIETAWQVRSNWPLGPHGCRVMGGRFFGPSYSFEETQQRTIGAEPRLAVQNAFGSVRVSPGEPGVVQARLRKVVFRADEEEAQAFADRIELRLTVDGSSARVETNRDLLRNGQLGLETHLEIVVPPDTVVSVRNEHGRVDLSGVRSADVVSSFDAVSIERLAEALQLDSRHGSVSVSEVEALDLKSRHGAVEVADLRGPAKIDSQHGSVTVRRSGRLEVRQQHGDVTAESVAGELVVRASHSAVRANDVQNRADVETSFAAVELARVGGEARVKVEHGRVSLEDVAGGATVQTSFDDIELDRVGGAVELAVHHGGIQGRGLALGARVRASGGDVVLDGFSGTSDIELERGNARLTPRAILIAPLTVSVKHGEAELVLPLGSGADIEAESRRGEIHSDLPQLRAADAHEGHGHRLSGRIAGGGTTVRLHADGDVRITTEPAAAITERPVARPEVTQASPVAPAESPGAAPAEAPPADETPRIRMR